MTSTVYDKNTGHTIKLDYRVIEERNQNSTTSDWLEFRYEDVDRHFLLSQTYLEMDVQIVRNNNGTFIPMTNNEPVSVIPNGWARFKRAQILMQDRIVADIEIDNTLCQNILTLPKYGTNHNNTLLDFMDFNIDEAHEFPLTYIHRKPIVVSASKTAVNTLAIDISQNPDFLVAFADDTNLIDNTNIYPATQSLNALAFNNQFNNWVVNILPTSTTNAADIGTSLNITAVASAGDIITLTTFTNMAAFVNRIDGYKISITPPDIPYTSSYFNKTSHQKRVDKYRKSRITKLILPLSESNIGIQLCNFEHFLFGIKWTLRLQKANDSDILIAKRSITNNHKYLIRNSRLNVAVISDSTMKSSNYEMIKKSIKDKFSIDYYIPVLFSKENTTANNIFWTKDFSMVEPPVSCFVCFKNGAESLNRNLQYVNPSFFDHCDIQEINIKINGKRLEDPNLSVKFTEARIATGSANVGDSSNVSNLDIAYMRFLDSMNRLDDHSFVAPMLTRDLYKQLYPVFYFDLKGIGSTLFTGVGSTMSLSVEYSLNSGITHVVYVLVVVHKKVDFDITSGVASINVSS